MTRDPDRRKPRIVWFRCGWRYWPCGVKALDKAADLWCNRMLGIAL